jgi:hypothetical protein
MKSKFLLACLGIVSIGNASSPSIDFNSNFNFDQNYPENIIINNRILLKINGKAITVIDVVRKMDLLFYRQYENLASSALARYQFYHSGWRTVLGMVIDDYLIMADAEEKQIKVNDGEVREELERLFGPEVVLNVDKLGMSLEEAFDLIKTELIVQRMTSMMVRSKAMTEVYPLSVKKRYERMLAQNPIQNVWVYHVLSVRGVGHESIAAEAYRLINELGLSYEEAIARLKTDQVELTFSDAYKQKEKVLSTTYMAVLGSLEVGGATSKPITNKTVSRLFCLKGIEKEGSRSFNEVAEELKKELTMEAIEKHNAEYRDKLRSRYGMTEKYLSQIIPADLQPFAMR